MKGFEEICDLYCRNMQEVETDLYALLCTYANQKPKRTLLEGDYKDDLRQFLYDYEFAIFSFPNILLTERGQDAIKRGWVVKDLKSIKKRDLTPIRQTWIAIGISGASLILSIFGIFYPIPKSQSFFKHGDVAIEVINPPAEIPISADKSSNCDSLNHQKNKN